MSAAFDMQAWFSGAPAPLILPGTLAWHKDEKGRHAALILDVNGPDTWALFLTSNPLWNARARKARRFELAYFEWKLNGVTTYLAPVHRRTDQFTPMGIPPVSRRHLKPLRKEFPDFPNLSVPAPTESGVVLVAV